MSSSEIQETQEFYPQSDDPQLLWEAIAIVDEKPLHFKIKWAGNDPKTGKPWKDSWTTKEDVTPDLVKAWRVKHPKKGKRKSKSIKESRASLTPSSYVSRAQYNLPPRDLSEELVDEGIYDDPPTAAAGPSKSKSQAPVSTTGKSRAISVQKGQKRKWNYLESEDDEDEKMEGMDDSVTARHARPKQKEKGQKKPPTKRRRKQAKAEEEDGKSEKEEEGKSEKEADDDDEEEVHNPIGKHLQKTKRKSSPARFKPNSGGSGFNSGILRVESPKKKAQGNLGGQSNGKVKEKILDESNDEEEDQTQTSNSPRPSPPIRKSDPRATSKPQTKENARPTRGPKPKAKSSKVIDVAEELEKAGFPRKKAKTNAKAAEDDDDEDEPMIVNDTLDEAMEDFNNQIVKGLNAASTSADAASKAKPALKPNTTRVKALAATGSFVLNPDSPLASPSNPVVQNQLLVQPEAGLPKVSNLKASTVGRQVDDSRPGAGSVTHNVESSTTAARSTKSKSRPSTFKPNFSVQKPSPKPSPSPVDASSAPPKPSTTSGRAKTPSVSVEKPSVLAPGPKSTKPALSIQTSKTSSSDDVNVSSSRVPNPNPQSERGPEPALTPTALARLKEFDDYLATLPPSPAPPKISVPTQPTLPTLQAKSAQQEKQTRDSQDSSIVPETDLGSSQSQPEVQDVEASHALADPPSEPQQPIQDTQEVHSHPKPSRHGGSPIKNGMKPRPKLKTQPQPKLPVWTPNRFLTAIGSTNREQHRNGEYDEGDGNGRGHAGGPGHDDSIEDWPPSQDNDKNGDAVMSIGALATQAQAQATRQRQQQQRPVDGSADVNFERGKELADANAARKKREREEYKDTYGRGHRKRSLSELREEKNERSGSGTGKEKSTGKVSKKGKSKGNSVLAPSEETEEEDEPQIKTKTGAGANTKPGLDMDVDVAMNDNGTRGDELGEFDLQYPDDDEPGPAEPQPQPAVNPKTGTSRETSSLSGGVPRSLSPSQSKLLQQEIASLKEQLLTAQKLNTSYREQLAQSESNNTSYLEQLAQNEVMKASYREQLLEAQAEAKKAEAEHRSANVTRLEAEAEAKHARVKAEKADYERKAVKEEYAKYRSGVEKELKALKEMEEELKELDDVKRKYKLYEEQMETVTAEQARLMERMEDVTKENEGLRKQVEDLTHAASSVLPLPSQSQDNIDELRDQVDELSKQIISTQLAQTSAEKDRDVFREQYLTASAFASEIRAENTNLLQRAEMAESSASSGLALIRSTFEGKLEQKDREIKVFKDMVDFMMKHDKQTSGEDIRRAAAEAPELRAEVNFLRNKLEEMRESTVSMEGALEVEQLKVEALEREKESEITDLRQMFDKKLEDSKRELARMLIELNEIKSKSARNANEGGDTPSPTVFRCEWRKGNSDPCLFICETRQELEDHAVHGGHIGLP